MQNFRTVGQILQREVCVPERKKNNVYYVLSVTPKGSACSSPGLIMIITYIVHKEYA
jgi:hypothetical protein